MNTTANRRRGFTLIELLVVIAIIAILASLLLPALTRAKGLVARTVCIGNFKQIQLTWHLYTDDNRDKLVINSFYWNPNPQHPDNIPSWVQGYMALDGIYDSPIARASSIDTSLLVGPRALFARYIPSPRTYKCPSDKTQVTVNGKRQDRVRSYCMNEYLGHPFLGLGEFAIYDPPYCHTLASLNRVPPSRLLVAIENHEDNIMSPIFPTVGPSEWSTQGVPATRHNGSCAVSFADGHVEAHRWVDPRTWQPVKGQHPIMDLFTPGSSDNLWVRDHMSTQPKDNIQ